MWFILIHIVCKWISIDRLYITMIDRQLRSIGSDILYYDNIYVLNLRKQNCMNNLAVKNKKFVCLFYCFHFFYDGGVEWYLFLLFSNHSFIEKFSLLNQWYWSYFGRNHSNNGGKNERMMIKDRLGQIYYHFIFVQNEKNFHYSNRKKMFWFASCELLTNQKICWEIDYWNWKKNKL